MMLEKKNHAHKIINLMMAEEWINGYYRSNVCVGRTGARQPPAYECTTRAETKIPFFLAYKNRDSCHHHLFAVQTKLSLLTSGT
jgi:hypothetical protein